MLSTNLAAILSRPQSADIEKAQVVEFSSMEDKELFILHHQYHACCWVGDMQLDVRSQDISSLGIDLS